MPECTWATLPIRSGFRVVSSLWGMLKSIIDFCSTAYFGRHSPPYADGDIL